MPMVIKGVTEVSETLPRHIKIPAHVISQTLDDQVVLLNLGDDHYYGLDRVGTRMFHLLKAKGDAEAIVPQLLEQFEIDEDTLRTDMAELLGKLQAAGLVVIE